MRSAALAALPVATSAPPVAAGFGMLFTVPAAAAVVDAAPKDRRGIASGILNHAAKWAVSSVSLSLAP